MDAFLADNPQIDVVVADMLLPVGRWVAHKHGIPNVLVAPTVMG